MIKDESAIEDEVQGWIERRVIFQAGLEDNIEELVAGLEEANLEAILREEQPKISPNTHEITYGRTIATTTYATGGETYKSSGDSYLEGVLTQLLALLHEGRKQQMAELLEEQIPVTEEEYNEQ